MFLMPDRVNFPTLGDWLGWGRNRWVMLIKVQFWSSFFFWHDSQLFTFISKRLNYYKSLFFWPLSQLLLNLDICHVHLCSVFSYKGAMFYYYQPISLLMFVLHWVEAKSAQFCYQKLCMLIQTNIIFQQNNIKVNFRLHILFCRHWICLFLD